MLSTQPFWDWLGSFIGAEDSLVASYHTHLPQYLQHYGLGCWKGYCGAQTSHNRLS